MNRNLHKAIEIAVSLLVMALLILWMAGVFGAKIGPGIVAAKTLSAPADAATATVEEVTVPIIEEAAGTVQAERKTVVSAQLVAVIREVRVRAGDPVNAGDPLIVLDDRELEAKGQEARRASEGAAAARTRAESDFRRIKDLRARNIVSQSEFEQAESTFRVADAEFERARQALQGADVALSYATIRSPVGGRIIDRFADPGDTAMPGRPLLSLYDPTALRIEVPVRESLVGRLKPEQSLQVRLGSEPKTIDGTVDEIVPQAEAGSRTFLVKVGLPKREGAYTGMFGRVLIPAGERQRLVVPEAAVERIGQLTFASVVDAGRQVSRRLITLGPEAGDGRLEVLSGLRAGETVLLRK